MIKKKKKKLVRKSVKRNGGYMPQSRLGCLIVVGLNNVMPNSEGIKSLLEVDDKAPQ